MASLFPDNDVALALSKSEISLPAGQGSQRSARRFGESRGCPPRRSHRTSRRVPCRRRPDAGIVAPRGDAEPPSPTPTFGGVVVIVRTSQQPDRATTTTTHPPSRRPAGTRSSPLSSRSPVRPVPKRTFRPRLSPRPPSRAFVGVRVNPDHPRCSLAPVVPFSAGAASAGAPASAGEVLKQLEDLLADAEAAIEEDPENESLLGQRTFFENQLERVQANSTYLDRLRPKVASGDAGYLQRIVLTVDKDLFDDEVYFWKNAMGMRVTRERKDVEGLNGGRCVVLSLIHI